MGERRRSSTEYVVAIPPSCFSNRSDASWISRTLTCDYCCAPTHPSCMPHPGRGNSAAPPLSQHPLDFGHEPGDLEKMCVSCLLPTFAGYEGFECPGNRKTKGSIGSETLSVLFFDASVAARHKPSICAAQHWTNQLSRRRGDEIAKSHTHTPSLSSGTHTRVACILIQLVSRQTRFDQRLPSVADTLFRG